MTPLLFLLCSCLATLAATKTAPEVFLREHIELHFERFIQEHDKQYVDEEEKQIRLEIFTENLERANVLNQQSEHAVFGITKFSDLTSNEFVKHFTGLGAPNLNWTLGCNDVSDGEVPDYNAPESFDWRQHSAVTRVKTQKHCGSCYAFSATGNIEGQYAIKNGRLIEFSEQQIIDCDTRCQGCDGGRMSFAFRSIIEQGGIDREEDYPYAGVQQLCQFTPSQAAVRLVECNLYNVVSQEKLKQLLYKIGPISIGVQATNFQGYRGGIMSDQACNVGLVNHAVLLVGYGTENGIPYWILKNSWDEGFGEQGYIRIQRGEHATSCGMMNNGFMASSIIM